MGDEPNLIGLTQEKINISAIKEYESEFIKYNDISLKGENFWKPVTDLLVIINHFEEDRINTVREYIFATEIIESKITSDKSTLVVVSKGLIEIINKDQEQAVNALIDMLDRDIKFIYLLVIIVASRRLHNIKLIKKCYEAYKANKTDRLKLEIYNEMILSGNRVFLKEIFEITSNLNEHSKTDAMIFDNFISVFKNKFSQDDIRGFLAQCVGAPNITKYSKKLYEKLERDNKDSQNSIKNLGLRESTHFIDRALERLPAKSIRKLNKNQKKQQKKIISIKAKNNLIDYFAKLKNNSYIYYYSNLETNNYCKKYIMSNTRILITVVSVNILSELNKYENINYIQDYPRECYALRDFGNLIFIYTYPINGYSKKYFITKADCSIHKYIYVKISEEKEYVLSKNYIISKIEKNYLNLDQTMYLLYFDENMKISFNVNK